jgi:hypothetical protein
VSRTVDPGHFLRVCRTAVGCTDMARAEGLSASPADLCERALRALAGYRCGCMWCEMLGDGRRGVVVSAYCSARFVEKQLGEDVAQRLLLVALETQP